MTKLINSETFKKISMKKQVNYLYTGKQCLEITKNTGKYLIYTGRLRNHITAVSAEANNQPAAGNGTSIEPAISIT